MLMRPTKLAKILLLTCLLTMSPSLLLAQTGQPVRLATGDDYKPFTDQGLPQGGMITAIVDHIFKTMGYEPEIEFHSWSRGYDLSEQAVFLGTFPYVKTPERLEEFHFSDPLYTIVTRFFVRADADLVFERDADLKGLTVCKPLGYNLTDIQVFLDQDIIKLQRPNTMESCFSMLRLGRVDLVPINEHVGWEVACHVSAGEDLFRVLDKSLQEDGLHFIVSKQHPEALDILQRFNAALQNMSNDGSLDAIVNEHLNGG